MAYSYDQFITAATGAGLLDKFTDDDLNVAKNNPEYGMSALKFHQDLLGAKTTEQKLLAQESLNQLRKSYGTGNAVQSSAVPSAGGSFNYGNQTIYQKLLEEVTNPKPFEYEVQEDPAFQSMKKSYLREGDRAREDTMAGYAAATGGVPSSAAITAAQQAGDYYAAQLNDSIPTMQQNAYQRYLADIDQKKQALDAVSADRQFDWNAYLQEWDKAWALYNELGYATPEIAQILGMGVQTKPVTGAPYTGNETVNPMAGAVSGGLLGVTPNLLEAAKGGGTGNDTAATEGGTTNRTGNGWVAIGNQRFTYEELFDMVESGQVKETVDPKTGKSTFTRVK